jgi:hypothetical protein
MPRKTATSLRIDPNVRALRIYPVEDTKKNVSDLQSVGIKLSQDQAVHLARVLLAMAQDHKEIDITGYRLQRRSTDGTYKITVTSMED